MVNKKDKTNKFYFYKLLQWILNSSLILLSFALTWLLGNEALNIIHLSIFKETSIEHKKILESILTFFLYFEFLAMIIKYFQENYHFPLRYFMYIGITATIRLIVVDHDDALETFYFTGAILLLVISYAIIKITSQKKDV